LLPVDGVALPQLTTTSLAESVESPIVSPDQTDAPHIMEVVGGASGTAYVGWLSGADPRGYAAYLRTFSIAHGWLSDPLQLSPEFGNTSVWPGDTIGLSTLSASDVVVSWGSATPSTGNKQSQIFAVHVRAQFH
jgi:hypothetical protein